MACTVTPGRRGAARRSAFQSYRKRPVLRRASRRWLRLLNLAASDIGFEPFAPEYWSAGNAFALVPVRSLEAMARARPDLSAWKDVFPDDGPNGAYLFCGDVVDRSASFHTRMFAPKMGLTEDPATGSAAATFAGVLAASGRYGDGERPVILEQGVEMGRPA